MKSFIFQIERLEQRTLLASAPPSVIGTTLTVTIVTGTPPEFPASGVFQLSFLANRNLHLRPVSGRLKPARGSYGYQRSQPPPRPLQNGDKDLGPPLANFHFQPPAPRRHFRQPLPGPTTLTGT